MSNQQSLTLFWLMDGRKISAVLLAGWRMRYKEAAVALQGGWLAVVSGCQESPIHTV